MHEFTSGKLSEYEYVKKHDMRTKGALSTWHDAKEAARNLDYWRKYVICFDHLGNRRNSMLEALDMSVTELKEIIQCGKSTANALVRTSQFKEITRDIGVEFLCHFGIIVRHCYALVATKSANLQWDNINFYSLRAPFIDERELRELITGGKQLENRRTIQGYILRTPATNVMDICLRLEIRKNGLIILDVANPDAKNLEFVMVYLKKIEINWNFFVYPTLDPQHFLFIFVGNAENGQMEKLMRQEFVWKTGWGTL